MATPVTKRVHMSAYKRDSIAKQTISSGGILVRDENNNVFKASTDITKGKNQTETIYSTGKGLKGLTDAQLKWREDEIKRLGGIDAYHKKYGDPKKGKPRNVDTGNAQNDVSFNYDPVLTDPTKGTQIDTSTAYGVRQIGRGQKKSAKDVRRASIKLSKLADFSYNEDGSINMESIKPKDTSNPRKMAKFNERLSELKNMQNTQKRISDMASSGVDPSLTARYEFGRGMKTSDPGGKPVIDTSGKYQTKKEFEENAKKNVGINLGTVNPDAGKGTQAESVAENLTEDREPKREPNKSLSSSYPGRADIGYSTMVAKKQGGVSMLKKGGMKMGGFGSKTYKK